MNLLQVSCFTSAQRHKQTLAYPMLLLYLGGLEYMNFYYPGRTPFRPPFELEAATPFLVLLPGGTTIQFQLNDRRENWVIYADFPEVTWDSAGQGTLNGTIPLQRFRQLTPQQGPFFRNLFQEVLCSHCTNLPAGIEKANLLSGAILSELIFCKTENSPQPVSAAAILKRAIDKDPSFRHSLWELNRQTGEFSLAHARKLFVKEFGILPDEYRARLRMNRIMELFEETQLSLKEVAQEVGMNHVTHLYAFLKSRQKLTPKKLLHHFRGT